MKWILIEVQVTVGYPLNVENKLGTPDCQYEIQSVAYPLINHVT